MALAQKGLAVGGYAGSASVVTDELDPIADTWGAVTSITGARYEARGFVTDVAGTGVKKVIAGGIGQLTSVEEYTHGADSWSTKAVIPSSGRSRGGGVNLGGAGYVLSGYNGGLVTGIEKYDIEGDSWSNVSDVNTARRDLGYFSDLTSRLLAFTCGGNTGSVVNNHEKWDSVAVTSTNMTVVPRTIDEMGSGAGGAENAGYLFGAKIAPLNSTHRYDINGDSWTTDGNTVAAARRGTTGHAAGSNLYNAGSDTGPSATSEKFDETAGTWASIGDLSLARGYSMGVGSPLWRAITISGYYYLVNEENPAWNEFSAGAIETGSDYGAVAAGQRTIYWRASTDVPDVQGIALINLTRVN